MQPQYLCYNDCIVCVFGNKMDANYIKAASIFKQMYGSAPVTQSACEGVFDAHPDLRATYSNYRSLQAAIYRGRASESQTSFAISTVAPEVPLSPSQQRQKDIIDKSVSEFDTWVAQKRTVGRWLRLAFISDIHIPYQDDRAISLMCQIVADYNPDVCTGLNDVFDFTEYGRWPDNRTPAAKLWTDDIENAFAAHDRYMRMIKDAAPNAKHLGLLSNHDKRLFRFMRDERNGTSEKTIADFLERLYSSGLWVFSIENENTIQLSDGLKLRHGDTASKNMGTVAKRMLEIVRGKSYKDDAGVGYNVVFGHTHRFVMFLEGGLKGVGNACLCKTTPHYMNYEPEWQQGITLVDYEPNGRRIQPYQIEFFPKGDKLVAYFAGREYIST